MSRGTDRIVIEGRQVYAAFERLGACGCRRTTERGAAGRGPS